MSRRHGSLIWGILVAIVGVLLLAPRSSYQPGALLTAHQQLSSDCTACHRPWRGPANEGCVNCHGSLPDSNPHSGSDVTAEDGLMAGRSLPVSASNSLECLSCHTEHIGAVVNLTVRSAFACTWCHKHPAIDKVTEHMVPAMARQFFVRHVFKRRFNHYEHDLLVKSHYPPIPGGFACTSCHLVPPVQPGQHEQMSLKWSGCAGVGCHVAPQDSFMQMPAGIGPSPITIAYSGAIPMRHIKAVFKHSAGHLESPCEQCHFRVATSKDPDDSASLAIKQCFTCHAHQPSLQNSVEKQNRGAAIVRATIAEDAPALIRTASNSAAPTERKVVACSECHLFHANGVVPNLDFTQPAPLFPPNHSKGFRLTFFVPHARLDAGRAHLGPIPLRRVTFGPWWMGLVAIGFVGYRFVLYSRKLAHSQVVHEAVAGVAPQRTKEVPALDDTYQTTVRHLYIVGEAAGTASINLAMRSGRQVIEAIANELKDSGAPARPELYDVVIVGCGPAGLGATATARAMGLKYATLEKLTPASTLRSYPRAKFVQATPIDIEEYGSFFLEGDDSREQLIREWEKIIGQLGLSINDREEVIDIVREQDWLVVKTARGNSYPARTVVLAIGVRGNPRHLNLPGEIAGRVFYTLIEPGEFVGRRILVVGGGNAGAETAQALTEARLGNIVSYSFRSPVLANVTRENAEAISGLQRARRITLYPSTTLAQIREHTVILEPVKAAPGSQLEAGAPRTVELENDVIFAMIGAELPTAFLKAIGIKMVSKGRAYG